MSTPVTALYGALLALLVIGLAAVVVRERVGARVGLGDGGNPCLARSIAAHRNAIEYVPVALLLLLVAEINGAPTAWLHGSGALLVVSRVLHAAGLARSGGTSFGRLAGTLGTWLAVLALASVNLAIALG